MHAEFARAGELALADAVAGIRARFGQAFVVGGRIRPDVLDAFRELAPDERVWVGSVHTWRRRAPDDPAVRSRVRGARRYAPLGAHLAGQPGPACALTFAAVATVVGLARLPDAAYRRGQWWQNNAGYPQARDGWLAAGWRVAAVDHAGEMVTFVRGGG
jgi:hypothetical protein